MSFRPSPSQQHCHSQGISDLTDISNLTEEALVSTVRDRFLQDKIYTCIRNSTLVAVNPYKDIFASDDLSERYLAEYKETDHCQPLLEPHIFQHVNQAYFHLRRTGYDQAIIFRYVRMHQRIVKIPRSPHSVSPSYLPLLTKITVLSLLLGARAVAARPRHGEPL